VEFFKDETARRCSRCGHRFANPNIAQGCAEWCAYAEKCVGLVPSSRLTASLREGALASRLIQTVKEELGTDQDRLNHVLMAFQHAKELAGREGGNPRVVLAATLLLRVGSEPAAGADDAAKVRDLLERLGLDDETVGRVLEIIIGYRTGQDPGTVDFNVVCDADRLADLASRPPDDPRRRHGDAAAFGLKTETARARARSLFQAEG
jgi:hypothetical protein